MYSYLMGEVLENYDKPRPLAIPKSWNMHSKKQQTNQPAVSSLASRTLPMHQQVAETCSTQRNHTWVKPYEGR